MKALLLGVILSLAISPAQAKGGWADESLDGHQIVDLKINKSEIALHLSYPGLSDNDCDIHLVITSRKGQRRSIKDFLERVDIKGVWYSRDPETNLIESHNRARLLLAHQTYVDGVIISTKDGSTLYELMNSLYGDGRVLATSAECTKKIRF